VAVGEGDDLEVSMASTDLIVWISMSRGPL
jgi:hypothetical protein